MSKTRREWLFNAGFGLGGVALNGFMPGGGVFSVPLAQAAATSVDPLAKKEPHFAPKVKSVIWLHMDGAPSTLDLYDYKPELVRLAGQEVPEAFLKGLQVTTSRRRRQALRL